MNVDKLSVYFCVGPWPINIAFIRACPVGPEDRTGSIRVNPPALPAQWNRLYLLFQRG